MSDSDLAGVVIRQAMLLDSKMSMRQCLSSQNQAWELLVRRKVREAADTLA